MKQWLLIYLVFSILVNVLPSGFVVSLFKIANLREHYHHHQTGRYEHDFFQFLADHYFGEHHEQDHQNHENLPFHHHHEQSGPLQQAPYLLPPTQKIAAFTKVELVENPLCAHTRNWFPSQYSGDIWQPPKA